MSLAVRIAVLVTASSCASSTPPPTPQPAPAADQGLAGAARQVASDLGQQLGAGSGDRTLVVDPFLEKTTGQQTTLSARLQEAVSPLLEKSLRNVTILAFDADGAQKARYVLTATIAVATPPDNYLVNASLTDRPSGLVVAQSAARFTEAGADASPTRFYNDSPSLVRDRSVDGYVKTSETAKGSAADALYVSQIPTAGLLSQALAAYNAEKWQDALDAYTAAAARPDGQQLRTFNGVYLSNLRLGRQKEAEEAFGKIAALGLATNNLSVKLLFRPGSSSEFWPGRDLAGVYPMWLRQIARAAQTAGSCLNVVGHTSKTGSEQVNDRLSLARAETVRRLLTAESAALGRRLRATGVGFRENIVGSGTDNAGDALDRRVEFKTVECS